MSKARSVTINSYKDSNGKISFDMVEAGNKTDTLVFNKTKDKMKKHENYDVQFTLVNNDGLELEFLQDTQHVMWVAKGNKSSAPACPQSHVTDPEFTVTGVAKTVLDVSNTDKDVCKYKFVLNFIDPGNGNKAEQFDPIYDNQNGGFQQIAISNNLIIGGFAAAATLLILLVAMERIGWLR
jgi:hypothetical protein